MPTFKTYVIRLNIILILKIKMKAILITLTILLACVYAEQADDIFLGEDHEPGFITIRDNGSDLFYWLMRSRGDK